MIEILIRIATALANNKEGKPVVYLAGKVTGLPYSQVKAEFTAKKAELEAKGFFVLSPLDQISESENWEKAMRISVIMLAASDNIFLQDNWSLSKGATLERNLSLPLGISMIED